MNKQVLFVPAILFVLCFQTGAQNSKPQTGSDKYVLVEGHKMHYQTAGTGSPTVIFESGHASTLEDWRDIFPAVAKMTRVVCYDRPGMGSSAESAKPRTYKQIVLELHSMLQQAKIPPPYILVGHSMGGGLIRAFASDYRSEVAGMVFVDPLFENMFKGIDPAELNKELLFMDSIMKNESITIQREHTMMRNEATTGFAELRSFELPDVPTALLVAGKDRPPGWTNGLIDLYQEKFQRLSDSRLIVLSQSPHYIQAYEPASIIEAIKKVLYPDPLAILRKEWRANGVDAAIAQFKKMRLRYPNELLPEPVLNRLGYDVLRNDPTGAIRLFSLNASLYPKSSNVYDSLGEAYMVTGNKNEAIKNYQLSLSLNAKNENAKEALKKLKEK